MNHRIFKLLIFALIGALIFGTYTPALADQPYVLEWHDEYDYIWFSCGDFDIRAVGVNDGEAKVKMDEQYNILRNNAQTRVRGKIINVSTGKYLIEDEQWIWNMFFEDNYSTKSVLAGTTWKIKYPNGEVVWQENGVSKYVGIYVNFFTGEIIFTDPYHEAGKKPDSSLLAETICAALR